MTPRFPATTLAPLLAISLISGCTGGGPSDRDITAALEAFSRNAMAGSDAIIFADISSNGCVENPPVWVCDVELTEVWKYSDRRKPFHGKISFAKQSDGWIVVDVKRSKQ